MSHCTCGYDTKGFGINSNEYRDARILNEYKSHYNDSNRIRIDSQKIYVDDDTVRKMSLFIQKLKYITDKLVMDYAPMETRVHPYTINCVEFVELIHGLITENPNSHFIDMFPGHLMEKYYPSGALVSAYLMQAYSNKYAIDPDYYLRKLSENWNRPPSSVYSQSPQLMP